jgi:murein DD-endopeptidase MepM/ murein hydrolase activator NlpD
MKWFIVLGMIGFMIVYFFINRETVYEVYGGDQYLGVVRNGTYVLLEYEKLKEEQMKNHPDYTHLPSSELKVIKKRDWFPEDETKRIMAQLPALVTPLVEAHEIRVDGATIAVVANEEQATKALNLLRTPYETQNGNTAELVEQIIFQKISADPESIVTAERAAELMSLVKVEPKTYQVEDGDTLWDIAQKTNTPFEQVVLMNSDTGDLLKAGQNVILSPEKRLVNVRTKTKKVEQQPIPYRTIVQSETAQEQVGKEGLKETVYQAVALNGIQVSSEKLEEKVLREPVDQIKQKRVRVQAASFRPMEDGSSGFIWPADGGIITSGFGKRDGEFHEGYDIAGARSLQIKASAAGKVIFSGWKNGYGNLIILSHSDGLTTYYAHNKENNVSIGDQVKQGQVIAVMGSTGNSTGVHVHFEIRSKGSSVDPGSYLE